jgi:predicted metal-dependent HD superfamily phosphohydrolase
VVVDCTFNEKSGRATPDLDWFYNGKAQQVERGLEWSVVAVVDLQQNTAYALSAQQTEAALSARVKSESTTAVTGMVASQTRHSDALDTHVNASLMALNLAKAALRKELTLPEP